MRGDHDAPDRHFERLSRLRDCGVSRHEPDPRGWKVVNRDGRAVGEVKDLIVDTDRMTATHFDVELNTKLFDLRNDDPHVLVPVEQAHRAGRRIVVEDISRAWVNELRTERDLHQREFWERWWSRSEPPRQDVAVNGAANEPPLPQG